MNLWVIFLTGLTIGGLTCLAVQGGLLASVIAARESEKASKKHVLYATSAFLLAKLIAYSGLGFILGLFGSAINITGTVQIFMQLLAGIYMILVALNLLNVHPIFRYAIIQPPRFLTKLVRNQSKSKDIFAPALLGAMTIFIPCGTTVAMEALAISSANPFVGASIMAAFTLGTIPLFFGIGFITSVLGDVFRTKFLKIAAVVVIFLGLSSVNGAFIALGIPINSQSLINAFTTQQDRARSSSQIPGDQSPHIFITSNGYTPDYVRVKKGEPVTLRVTSKDAYSCAVAFRIPALGISKNFKSNETFTINFTPKKVEKITYTCSMGMYTGVIEVYE